MKPIEQRDRYNQRLKLTVEQPNGELANFDRYMTGLLKTQSLEAWNGNQAEFKRWAATRIADYVNNLEFVIVGYSADAPATA